MKEGLIALNYECSKCNERMGLYERKSAVLDGDFEWVCSTITSQNIYGRTPMILLTMRPSRLFVKIRCHAVASTRKRSAVRKVLDVKNNNVVIWKAGKRLTINVDQVRIYRHRKCDETEIGTGSSDNGNLRDESSGFDRVQRRSNESRDGYKRSNESRSGGPERKVQKGSEHRVNKRGLSSNNSNSVLPRLRKKNRREEMVTPTTSGYILRPRKGKREESRLTIDRKTQQGGPVRSRKGRERNYSPYIEERTKSSNTNARRGADQQRQDQERRGTCTKKSLSLEVLVGNTYYKS
ncbi:uncharacterized protein TNCV_3405801 [Trichonephila clavipes]|nr:uncharacterized protein TNCV_3405801 [Trichonephila clavipes]